MMSCKLNKAKKEGAIDKKIVFDLFDIVYAKDYFFLFIYFFRLSQKLGGILF